MKKFNDLSLTEKEKNIDIAFSALTKAISNKIVEITFMNPKTQKRYEKMLKKDDSFRNIYLHLTLDKGMQSEIMKLAVAAAQGSEYHDDGEPIMDLQ